MDRYTVRDITKYEMTLVATNNQNQKIKVIPEILKEQLNEACRYVNVVAIANVLPGMTKLEISDGTTSMEVPFKSPRLRAPSPVIICISPQFIAEQWQTFIAHVHVARRFGGHLHLYVTSMIDSFFDLLTEYEKLGYVTVDFWIRHDIPEVNEESELRNQAGAQTDCLLQYKEAAEFVAFFDLDDILFPVHQNDYLNEFRMLYSIHPDILTFHYNKRETIAHNKAVISDINFFDLFNHTWFVNEEDYGKTVTRPEHLKSMWIHEPFNIPYSRKHTIKDNHLVHIQKPVDSDGKETIPWRLSNFERIEGMRKNETVLILRKVSRDLRNFIDDTEPDLKLSLISVTFDPLLIWLKSTGEPMEIGYQKVDDGCQLNVDRHSMTFLENVHPKDIFLDDLNMLLRLQKSILPYFEMSAHRMTSDILMTKNKLRVKKLLIKTSNPHDAMKMLQYTCPMTIEEFGIYDIKMSNEAWKMDEIMASGHWKKAKKFENLEFNLDASVLQLTHFDMVNVHVKEVSAEELLELKKHYLNSPDFSYFYIGYQKLLNPHRLPEFLGPPLILHPDHHDNGRWYFKCRLSECLYIQHFGTNVFMSSIDREMVPKGGILQ
uniref:Glycosyltransferase family 92 protein n=1 Tax=Caenorhabditis tropicalis TaxID=1561998 RepID=A0A1I7UDW0_9PELO